MRSEPDAMALDPKCLTLRRITVSVMLVAFIIVVAVAELLMLRLGRDIEPMTTLSPKLRAASR